MTLSRLLPAALMVCSLPAFAQDQQPTKLPPSSAPAPAAGAKTVAANEPWRIIPNLSLERASGNKIIDPNQSTANLQGSQFKSGAPSRPLVLRADGQDADLTCYTIRSYVVARDSKDSDSTHPAGYSTCRPSDRYQVKTTEMRVVEER